MRLGAFVVLHSTFSSLELAPSHLWGEDAFGPQHVWTLHL